MLAHTPTKPESGAGSSGTQRDSLATNNSSTTFPDGNDVSTNMNPPVLTQISEVRSIKLPPFWQNDPALWFAQVEAQFFSHRITADNSRYFTIVGALDSSVLEQVSDLIRSPPANERYLTLKSQLIERFTDSRETQLHKLLTEMQLGDRKPSQLLREMRTLATDRVSEDLLHSLWIKRMPTSVRCVLSASEGVDLAKLADIADKITEATAHSQVMAVRNKSPGRRFDVADLQERIGQIERQLETLIREVRKEEIPRAGKEPAAPRRSRSASRKREADICFYHRRFGIKAHRCIKPCVFEGHATPQTSEN